MIAFATNPVKRRLLLLFPARKNLTAFIMTLGAFLLIIGPSFYLIFNLTTQIIGLYHRGTIFFQSGAWENLQKTALQSFSGYLPSPRLFPDIDLREFLMNSLKEISGYMAKQLGGVLKNTFILIVNFIIMILTLFFFYRDGEHYYSTILQMIPFQSKQKVIVSKKFLDTFSAVIFGVFLIALIQGILTGIGMAIFGVPFFLFWGVLAFLSALIPVLGAAFVWVPGVLYIFLTGHTVASLLFALWGVLLISTPDNFLRPLLIGNRARLPVFFLYIGILGGLKVYGMAGILLGPLIVTMVIAFALIYREDYMTPVSREE